MFSGTSLALQIEFAAAMASLSASGAPLIANGTAATSTTDASSSKLDALQAMLQKKIADMLNQGDSLSQIVQQLASSLASQFAQQFGGRSDADPSATAIGVRSGAVPTGDNRAAALDRRYCIGPRATVSASRRGCSGGTR